MVALVRRCALISRGSDTPVCLVHKGVAMSIIDWVVFGITLASIIGYGMWRGGGQHEARPRHRSFCCRHHCRDRCYHVLCNRRCKFLMAQCYWRCRCGGCGVGVAVRTWQLITSSRKRSYPDQLNVPHTQIAELTLSDLDDTWSD